MTSLRKLVLHSVVSGLLWGCGWAQEHQIQIDSSPSGASITDTNGQHLGVTGKPIWTSSKTQIVFLALPGHEKVRLSLRDSDFPHYPETVTLPAETPWIWLQDAARERPSWLLGGGLLLGLSLVGLVKAKESLRLVRRRAEILQAYQSPDGSPTRSLIAVKLGPYRVVSELGKGGMSEVYLALPEDSRSPEHPVAIKVLNLELRDRDDLRTRFKREIEVASQLVHPGIVEVYDHGWHQDRQYLAMEFVQGQDLTQILPTLGEDWARRGEIWAQLTAAVVYAHQHNVFHRDLKPDNVRVTPEGRVKVMDFGLARELNSLTLTEAGTAIGTPRYIAPEAIHGRGVDDRSDQYSLGVIAYEMLSGRRPFESDELLNLLYCHSSVTPDPPSSKCDRLSPEIDRVILRMLEKNPDQRYPTVEQAAADLLKAMDPLCRPG